MTFFGCCFRNPSTRPTMPMQCNSQQELWWSVFLYEILLKNERSVFFLYFRHRYALILSIAQFVFLCLSSASKILGNICSYLETHENCMQKKTKKRNKKMMTESAANLCSVKWVQQLPLHHMDCVHFAFLCRLQFDIDEIRFCWCEHLRHARRRNDNFCGKTFQNVSFGLFAVSIAIIITFSAICTEAVATIAFILRIADAKFIQIKCATWTKKIFHYRILIGWQTFFQSQFCFNFFYTTRVIMLARCVKCISN